VAPGLHNFFLQISILWRKQQLIIGIEYVDPIIGGDDKIPDEYQKSQNYS
jgi:hypothetical protein